jgi:protein CpxP
MKTFRPSLFALTLVPMSAALAQTSAPAPAPPTPPAVVAPSATPVPDSPSAAVPPVPGANSFTESEARSRIEANGYSDVTDLQKDEQSIWRGKAMKDGKSVSVSLDFQGHVVAE